MTKYISTLVRLLTEYIIYYRSDILDLMYILNFLLYNLGYHSSLYSLIGSIIAHTTSTNSSSSALRSCDTYLIRSITLASSSSFSSLKTFVISKLSIKGTVLLSSFAFACAKWLIMPLQWLLPQAHCYAYVVAVILLLGKIIPTCSCCADKKLVCIAITAPFGRQPSSCSKCTSVNMRLSCNVRLVSDAEYIFYIHLCLYSAHSASGNTWCCTRFLALLYIL